MCVHKGHFCHIPHASPHHIKRDAIPKKPQSVIRSHSPSPLFTSHPRHLTRTPRRRPPSRQPVGGGWLVFVLFAPPVFANSTAVMAFMDHPAPYVHHAIATYTCCLDASALGTLNVRWVDNFFVLNSVFAVIIRPHNHPPSAFSAVASAACAADGARLAARGVLGC